MLAAQGAAGVSARGKGDVQGMGMKIKDQHLWDGECEITVGALLALTDDDKRRVKIDGKPMRVKDAYRSHAEHVVSDWGFFGHCDMTGTFHPPKSDDGGEPCLVWIDTKEAQAARGRPKTVELKANEFSDMCINAERYAIGRGNHVSVDCARSSRGTWNRSTTGRGTSSPATSSASARRASAAPRSAASLRRGSANGPTLGTLCSTRSDRTLSRTIRKFLLTF